ncbi:hypothetical protein MUP77_01325 [Candidatus Bathyarchaeota archaeon]|nr:hypothetical protein [Candidatus Bathyarchaeota archaeon]
MPLKDYCQPRLASVLGNGFKASWWGSFTRKLRATGQAIVKVRLTGPNDVPDALLYKYPLEKYRHMISGAAKESPDNAIIPEDETTSRNLAKLIIANEVLGYVIVTKFPDTDVERVCALNLNPDGTVVLKELIPSNLVLFNEEVMKVDKTKFTPAEVEEAKAFLQNIPEATEDVFAVNDYRIIGLGDKTVSPKVMELQAILAMKKPVEATAST